LFLYKTRRFLISEINFQNKATGFVSRSSELYQHLSIRKTDHKATEKRLTILDLLAMLDEALSQ